MILKLPLATDDAFMGIAEGTSLVVVEPTVPIRSSEDVVFSCTIDWAATVDGVDGAGGADQPRLSPVFEWHSIPLNLECREYEIYTLNA